MSRPLRPRDDDGSILIAMLGALMVAGLVIALFSRTINANTQAVIDRNFQGAILAADSAIQDAMTDISQNTNLAASTLSGSSTIGGGTYAWDATRVGNRWEVRAVGTVNGRSRTVEATVERASRFIVGAFADVAFTMRGANGADSYSHSSGASGLGNGSIGSNGTITMNGNAFADTITLYGPDANCTGAGCSSGQISGIGTAFDIDAVAAEIADEAAAACGGYTAFTASTGGSLTGGSTYCFSAMDIDQDLVLSGASSSNPVIVYLAGDLDVANHTQVNCVSCVDETSTPDSGALQVYSLGTTVAIGNQGHFAMALAAPNASCHGSPSNAQAHIYGAMICDDLSNQGGWDFHYDEDLALLGNGRWDITAWREEPGGTTSF